MQKYELVYSKASGSRHITPDSSQGPFYDASEVDALLKKVVEVFGGDWREEAVTGEWAERANALIATIKL